MLFHLIHAQILVRNPVSFQSDVGTRLFDRLSSYCVAFCVVYPRIQRCAWIARQSNSDLTSRIQEASAAIRVLKANQAEATAIERFNRDSNLALDNAFKLRVKIVCMQIAVA